VEAQHARFHRIAAAEGRTTRFVYSARRSFDRSRCGNEREWAIIYDLLCAPLFFFAPMPVSAEEERKINFHFHYFFVLALSVGANAKWSGKVESSSQAS
jgi:hypothetical protein